MSIIKQGIRYFSILEDIGSGAVIEGNLLGEEMNKQQEIKEEFTGRKIRWQLQEDEKRSEFLRERNEKHIHEIINKLRD